MYWMTEYEIEVDGVIKKQVKPWYNYEEMISSGEVIDGYYECKDDNICVYIIHKNI